MGEAGQDVPVLLPQSIDVGFRQLLCPGLICRPPDVYHVIDHTEVLAIMQHEVAHAEVGVDLLPELYLDF